MLEGFCELGEQKDFAWQKTERERALEVQFSGGILEFGEFLPRGGILAHEK